MRTLGIAASWCLVCQLPLATTLRDLRTQSFAEWGFERARHHENAHTPGPLGGIIRSAANGRISAAIVVCRCPGIGSQPANLYCPLAHAPAQTAGHV